jgi:hypothetical protein
MKKKPYFIYKISVRNMFTYNKVKLGFNSNLIYHSIFRRSSKKDNLLNTLNISNGGEYVIPFNNSFRVSNIFFYFNFNKNIPYSDIITAMNSEFKKQKCSHFLTANNLDSNNLRFEKFIFKHLREVYKKVRFQGIEQCVKYSSYFFRGSVNGLVKRTNLYKLNNKIYCYDQLNLNNKFSKVLLFLLKPFFHLQGKVNKPFKYEVGKLINKLSNKYLYTKTVINRDGVHFI